MSTEAGFLAAIRTAPDDDGVRLIYSDWLEDHHFADRAELIRVQIALADLAEDDPRRPALAAREQELLGGQPTEWVELSPAVPVCAGWCPERWPGLRAAYHRGLIDVVCCEADMQPFLACAAVLFAYHPVGRVRFDFLASADEVGGGGSEFPGPIDPAAVAQLAACPSLGRVRDLGLHRGQLTPDAAEPLAGSPHLAGLKTLHLEGCEFAADGLATVLGAGWAAGLEALDLRGVWYSMWSMSMGGPDFPSRGWTPETLEEVVRAALPRLRVLDLSGRDLYESGVDVLLAAAWPDLRELRLSPHYSVRRPFRERLATKFGDRVKGLD